MKIANFFAGALLAAQAAADAMVGTNIGGWMVLEPWITPSLFYRFLEKTHSEGVGIDSYTFCEALGPVEGNAVMRAHWDAWFTEDHAKQLSERNVEIVRIPIGDWTLTPYGPYIGCMDGATEKIEWALDLFATYGIKVLIDVHGLKDSQNGYDNSGQASDLEWIDETHFKHWSIQNASWMGHWNGLKYDEINMDNINWAIDNVTNLMNKWGSHPAVYALESVNEPWQNSDIPTLKAYYRSVRQVMKDINPDIKFVFHDAFLTSHLIWNDLFEDDDMENVVMDTHQYLAWSPALGKIDRYCDVNSVNLTGPRVSGIKYDIWVGEWSLATDVCAQWLSGFNDSRSDGDYQYDCQKVECPYSYLPAEHAVDFDRTAAMLGPYGESTRATIQYGMCFTDSDYFSFDEVQEFADCQRQVFDDHFQGQFLWNFRNELEPRWSYVQAYDLGWINYDQTNTFLQL